MAHRLWKFVDKSGGPNACWPWQRCTNDFGYGIIRLNGRNYRAHRVAYELVKGPIPDGMHVLHSCDNPPCCNPRHLRVGDNADNARDRMERGRAVNPPVHVGEKNPSSRLTEDQVLEIRASGLSVQQLADRYGVRRGTINFILQGHTWKHLLEGSDA